MASSPSKLTNRTWDWNDDTSISDALRTHCNYNKNTDAPDERIILFMDRKLLENEILSFDSDYNTTDKKPAQLKKKLRYCLIAEHEHNDRLKSIKLARKETIARLDREYDGM